MLRYSILTYNFNDYEIMWEPKLKSPNCDYIYITDNPNLKSDTWNIVLENLKLKSFSNVWDKVFYVRYHPFEFCKTKYCICLDGSIQINKSLDAIVQNFIDSKCDIGVLKHPDRHDINTELQAWIRLRGYPFLYTELQRSLISLLTNYDDTKLYAVTLRLCKNLMISNTVDTMVYSFLKYLGYKQNTGIDRLDQTIYTMVVHHFFKDIKIQLLDFNLIRSDKMKWCRHHCAS